MNCVQGRAECVHGVAGGARPRGDDPHHQSGHPPHPTREVLPPPEGTRAAHGRKTRPSPVNHTNVSVRVRTLLLRSYPAVLEMAASRGSNKMLIDVTEASRRIPTIRSVCYYDAQMNC